MINSRITANTTEFHFGEPLSILTHVMSTEKSLDGTIRAQVDAKLNSFSTEALPTVITSIFDFPSFFFTYYFRKCESKILSHDGIIY